jgi:hypothetical protein
MAIALLRFSGPAVRALASTAKASTGSTNSRSGAVPP